MTERLDLPRRYRQQIEALLREHVPCVEVWAYGSRVSGRSHKGSDLDLVLRGPDLKRIDSGQLMDLTEALEESNVPIIVQTHDWAGLPERFHREIEREYVVVQQRVEENSARKSGWETTTWGELATLEYGKSLRGYQSSEGPYRVFGTNGPIGWHDKMLCTHPSVIIGRKGAYRGVHYSATPFFVIDTAFYLKPKVEMDTRWAYYELLTQDINGLDSGSAIPSTSRKDFYGLPVQVPSLPEQRAIAHILGTLDDKIELNRRMNETLEEMARALFKSWFVDFDPVRAKMEGRDTGLPPDVADLFPDRLVGSELGEIPEGWEVGVLDDAIELLNGGTPRTSVASYWNGDIPWYTAKDAPSLSDIFVLDTERTITQAGVENSSTKILPAGTTIITARGTVGSLACLGIPMAMNQTCYGIQGARGYSDFFTYWTVRRAVDELQSRTHGTIFDTITRQTFKIVDMVLPPVNVSEAFECTVNPIMKRILNNLHESQTLTALRDTLLPKLISGEMRVNTRDEESEAVIGKYQ